MESTGMSRTIKIDEMVVAPRHVAGGPCISVETEEAQIAAFWTDIDSPQALADAQLFMTAKQRIEAANRMQLAVEALLEYELPVAMLSIPTEQRWTAVREAFEAYKKLKE